MTCVLGQCIALNLCRGGNCYERNRRFREIQEVKVSDPKFVFLTRIRPQTGSTPGNAIYVCESYKGNASLHTIADNPDDWSVLFTGTREECENYTANLHHSIDPKMAGSSRASEFNPRQDVRRRI